MKNKMYLGEWSPAVSASQNPAKPNHGSSESNRNSSAYSRGSTANQEEQVDDSPTEKPVVHAVKLYSGEFNNGGDPIEFNKACKVSIKAERPPECFHDKVEFKLFSTFNGNTVDLSVLAQGYFNESGVAEASLTLYYNDEYYEYLHQNPKKDVTVEYFFKAYHKDLSEPVESARLIMPISKEVFNLECATIHFGTGRKILLPDIKDTNSKTSPTGITAYDAFLTVLEYAKQNPNKSLVIVGHTDSVGTESSNKQLSFERAQNIAFFIAGKAKEWVAHSFENHKADDVQHILSWANRQFGFNSDPQGIDNIFGEKSKLALKNFRKDFQSQINPDIYQETDFQSGQILKNDFLAFYTLYNTLLAKAINLDLVELQEQKEALIFTNPSAIGCGEDFPVDKKYADNQKDQQDRRVDFVFFETSEIPDLSGTRAGTHIYGPLLPPLKPITPKAVAQVAPVEPSEYADEIDFILCYVLNDGGTKDKPGKGAYYLVPAESVDAFMAEEAELEVQRKKMLEVKKIKDQEQRDKAILEQRKLLQDFFGTEDNELDFKELIPISYPIKYVGKGVRYIRSDKVKNHWRKLPEKEIRARFEEEFSKSKLNKQKKPKPLEDYVSAKLKAKLWTGWENGDVFNPKWSLSSNKDALNGSKYFDGGCALTFARWSSQGGLDSEFDLKDGVLNIGATASATFSAVEAKVSYSLNLPDKDGVDLVNLVRKYISKGAFDKDKSLRMLYKIEGEATGFVGASVAVSLPSLDFNLTGRNSSLDIYKNKKEKQKAVAEASASFFAGAKGSIGITISLEWKSAQMSSFKPLVAQGGKLTGAAGVAGEAKIKFEYKDGKVVFIADAKLVLVLGGGGEIEYELDIQEGFNLIAYLMGSINYHKGLGFVGDTFRAYMNYQLLLLIKKEESAEQIVGNIKSGTYELIKKVTSWWNTDDKVILSNKKPKKLLIASSPRGEKYLQNAPPETLGKLIHLIMSKPEQKDFSDILDILEAAKSAHEFKWIIRNINKDQPKDVNKGEKLSESEKVRLYNDGKEKLEKFFGIDDPKPKAERIEIKQLKAVFLKYGK